MMHEINIEVKDCLTPISCAKLVIKIIKYILYSTQQIPFSYEILSHIMDKETIQVDEMNSDEITAASSVNEMLLEQFLRKISFIYRNYEDTFKNLELEFIENGGVKELIVLIGNTVLMPKKVFRIEIPQLSHCQCTSKNSLERNFIAACRQMFNSEDLHNYINDQIQPMNIYFLMRLEIGLFPKTDWFLPNENFVVPNVSQIVIKLKQPENVICTCSTQLSESPLLQDFSIKRSIVHESKLTDEIDSSLWFQPKENLKGIKDNKVNGLSAFNLLKFKKVTV